MCLHEFQVKFFLSLVFSSCCPGAFAPPSPFQGDSPPPRSHPASRPCYPHIRGTARAWLPGGTLPAAPQHPEMPPPLQFTLTAPAASLPAGQDSERSSSYTQFSYQYRTACRHLVGSQHLAPSRFSASVHLVGSQHLCSALMTNRRNAIYRVTAIPAFVRTNQLHFPSQLRVHSWPVQSPHSPEETSGLSRGMTHVSLFQRDSEKALPLETDAALSPSLNDNIFPWS